VQAVLSGDWLMVAIGIGCFLGGLVAAGIVLGNLYQSYSAPARFVEFAAKLFLAVSLASLVFLTLLSWNYAENEWVGSFIVAGVLPVAAWIVIKLKMGPRRIGN
jgi:hypothetical protein